LAVKLLIIECILLLMGWLCENCGNNREFIELNQVKTYVLQDGRTEIRRAINKYLDNPLMEVRCRSCYSKNVRWILLKDQNKDYQFVDDSYVSEHHEIDLIALELTKKKSSISKHPGNEEELSVSLLKRLLEENLQMVNPIQHFEISGYETNPLSHTRYQEILELIHSASCQANIITNGTDLLKKMDQIKMMKDISYTLVIRGTETDDTWKALDLTTKKKIGCDVYLELNSQNWNQIEQTYKKAKHLGARNFIPIEKYPLIDTDDLMTDDMKKKAIFDIERLGFKKSIQFSPYDLKCNCTYLRYKRLFINAQSALAFCHFLAPLDKTVIIPTKEQTLLELIQKNNKIRQGFLKNKDRLFFDKKMRETASPCSYCLHAFGVKAKW